MAFSSIRATLLSVMAFGLIRAELHSLPSDDSCGPVSLLQKTAVRNGQNRHSADPAPALAEYAGKAPVAHKVVPTKLADVVVTKPIVFSTGMDACIPCSIALSKAPEKYKCYSYKCTEEFCSSTDGYMYTALQSIGQLALDLTECPSDNELPKSFTTDVDACVASYALSKIMPIPDGIKFYEYLCTNVQYCGTNGGFMYAALPEPPTFPTWVTTYAECKFEIEPAGK